MRLKTRLAILAGFVVIFLVTAPLLLLYTAGYRWNFKKNRIEKVGVVFVRSVPSNAEVALNGVAQKDRTPARFRDLLPDTYDIRVSKDGFTSWEKHLAVESERTTFAESIVLWRDSVTLGMLDVPPYFDRFKESILARNPKTDDTFATDGFEIYVTHKDGTRETITRLGEKVLNVLPYPNGAYVFYQTANTVHAIELDGRDQRNDNVLATSDGMVDMAIDGDTLFFETKKDGVVSVFSRPLQ